MEYPFSQLVSTVWAMSPSNLLPTPSLVAFGRGVGVGKTALVLCEYCSAVGKTLVCYQHLSSYKYKAQCYEGGYGEVNSILARPNMVYFVPYF